MTALVHQLLSETAMRQPDAQALRYQEQSLSYRALSDHVSEFSDALLTLGVRRSERVAIYLEKRFENVIAMFAAWQAGAVMVPVNPLLKQEQISYQLNHCQAAVLITSTERFETNLAVLRSCPSLRCVIVVGRASEGKTDLPFRLICWEEAMKERTTMPPHPVVDMDMAAILYTSGSTGKPKGVVCSHRNLVAGAQSVSSYLHNNANDRVLCVLPFSFDYGLSQLTTVFLTGGTAVLLNYLLPNDIIQAIRKERITGLAAIPPLWGQLSLLDWSSINFLRFATNSGGAMPRSVLNSLRQSIPNTRIYLMYGLTEAFRSTYLDPDEVDIRPDSIGKAIPNNEVLVVRPDGTECDVDEVGELVHRGALVSQGYWNDIVATSERFKPLPIPKDAWRLPEIAVWSGDLVRKDSAGYLYYVGRNNDMIKISGYRISTIEIEEVLFTLPGMTELAVVGVAHPHFEQALVAVVKQNAQESLTTDMLRRHCQRHLPAYMQPKHFSLESSSLPRNANGKINRLAVSQRFATFFQSPDDASQET
ncbi:acyl-CoA ligase (AMP-forming), exosortase A system-associated [Undibacterium sp. SXout20W]|uniref:acyl-CoA ligase (AMP-forming), exosortase A system-associated n=1 Tax=Undibacterium sp. SXout20W TaxID=3413051 RepID=UPI003BEF91C4